MTIYMVFFVSPKHYAVVFLLTSLAYVVVSLGRCCSYPRSRCSAQVRIPRMVMVPIPLPTVTCISCPICQTSGNYILRDRNRGHITIPVSFFFRQGGQPPPLHKRRSGVKYGSAQQTAPGSGRQPPGLLVSVHLPPHGSFPSGSWAVFASAVINLTKTQLDPNNTIAL